MCLDMVCGGCAITLIHKMKVALNKTSDVSWMHDSILDLRLFLHSFDFHQQHYQLVPW